METMDDPSGSVVIWQACIFREYKDLSGIARIWSESCDAVAIAQHGSTDPKKRTHCHFMLVAPKHKADTMRKQVRTYVPDLEKRQGQFWLSENVQKGVFKGKPYDRHELLKYMTKGNVFNVKYQFNVTDEEVYNAASKYVKHSEQIESAKAEERALAVKKLRVPITQQVINLATERWLIHRKKFIFFNDGKAPPQDILEIVEDAYIEVNKGLNPYHIRDIAYAVLYKDSDYKAYIKDVIKSQIKI